MSLKKENNELQRKLDFLQTVAMICGTIASFAAVSLLWVILFDVLKNPGQGNNDLMAIINICSYAISVLFVFSAVLYWRAYCLDNLHKNKIAVLPMKIKET